MAVARHASLISPAPTPLLLDGSGAFLAQLGHVADGRTEYGYWVVDPAPDRVVRATLALEDRRYFRHPGIDPAAMLRAAWQDATGSGRSGASTIAMQVARMQNPRPRTLWAKAVEAGTAVALTLRYGRAAILAQYLRLAPYANGSHGIAHAARLYFDKPVADLSWAEIALLAAIPQAPAAMNPLHPAGLVRAIRRGGRVLDGLAKAGVIPPGEMPLARAQLAAIAVRPAPRRPEAALPSILRLSQTLRAGQGPPLDPADPRLRATLDLRLQTLIAALLHDRLAIWRDAAARQAAAMVIRRRDHAVLTAIGAGDPAAAGGAIDFTRAMRSPGSTLKPFIYALALSRGVLRASDAMADRPEAAWGIANADGAFLGPMLPRQALANSRNVPAAALLRRTGLDAAFDALRDLGLHDRDGPAERFGLSMAIGALPTSLDRLARAYAALADGGVLSDLVWLSGAPAMPPRRVMPEDTARLVTLFLADPMARLPSFPRYGESEFPFAVALKTGTSQGYRDAWTVAWSRDYLVGVWVGRADDRPMRGLSGARAAGSVAQEILLGLHRATRGDFSGGGFAPPAGRVARELCVDSACAARLTEYLPDRDELSVVADTARLSIVAPEANARIWRNPEAPAAANRIMLKASASAEVTQIVWLVDGVPLATAPPGEAIPWTLARGAHRFQIRLPFAATASATVRIVVE